MQHIPEEDDLQYLIFKVKDTQKRVGLLCAGFIQYFCIHNHQNCTQKAYVYLLNFMTSHFVHACINKLNGHKLHTWIGHVALISYQNLLSVDQHQNRIHCLLINSLGLSFIQENLSTGPMTFRASEDGYCVLLCQMRN